MFKVLVPLLIVLFIALFWYETSPAEADDINRLVVATAKSQEARKALADELNKNPNPSRYDFSSIKSRVNEVLVVETAKAVTGNNNIRTEKETDALQAAAAVKQQQEVKRRLDAIMAKPLDELNFSDVVMVLAANFWMLFSAWALCMLIVMAIRFRPSV